MGAAVAMVSTWTAVVPAVAALLGVVLGQFWQGRRDEKRWEREHTLERERREDQRARDNELWAREDRARFTDKKREIYAEYQTLAYRVATILVKTDRAYREAAAAGEPSGNLDRGDYFREHEFFELFGRTVDELRVVRNHIRLIAPPEVVHHVTRIDEALNPAIPVMTGGNITQVRDLWSNLRGARFKLLDVMRKDLDPESSPLVGVADRNFVPDAGAVRWPDLRY